MTWLIYPNMWICVTNIWALQQNNMECNIIDCLCRNTGEKQCSLIWYIVLVSPFHPIDVSLFTEVWNPASNITNEDNEECYRNNVRIYYKNNLYQSCLAGCVGLILPLIPWCKSYGVFLWGWGFCWKLTAYNGTALYAEVICLLVPYHSKAPQRGNLHNIDRICVLHYIATAISKKNPHWYYNSITALLIILFPQSEWGAFYLFEFLSEYFHQLPTARYYKG